MRTSAYWRAAALALLLWAALPAAAQTAFYLPEPTADTWLKAKPFYLARVVDARPQHTSLGLVTRTGAHPPCGLLFRQEFRRRSARFLPPTCAAGHVGGLLLASATAPSGSKRVLFTLHVLTGKNNLSQSTIVASAIVGRPTQLFIYRPRDAKGSVVRIRLADAQPPQELAAGDFLTFEPTSEQPLRVCLLPATGPETYLSVMPTAEAPIYLECRPTEPEPLRRVKDAAGPLRLMS